MTDLTLYYAPRTRAWTALWLLEELGRPYTLESFSLATGRHKQADYLAMNPLGKVPLVLHAGQAVSELGAIAIYLADRFPEAQLAPAIDDPRRADFLRWCFFSSAIIEPAFAQRFMQWEIRPSTAAWGSFEQMLEVATAGCTQAAPWLLGEQFTAADVLVGSGLEFGVKFNILPKDGPIAAYTARCMARAAAVRATAIETREGERFPMQG